jgi:hypothetical protein
MLCSFDLHLQAGATKVVYVPFHNGVERGAQR